MNKYRKHGENRTVSDVFMCRVFFFSENYQFPLSFDSFVVLTIHTTGHLHTRWSSGGKLPLSDEMRTLYFHVRHELKIKSCFRAIFFRNSKREFMETMLAGVNASTCMEIRLVAGCGI